jgi:UV DNA damage endonuclease
MNLGYACINMELNARKGDDRITTNRTMIKKTFHDKGVDYASELVLQNVSDLYQIIEWNEQNNIKFFRLSSDMFPWASEYYQDWGKFPNIEEITNILRDCGNLANKYGHRITSHPGPFNVLVSPNENVVQNTITDLTIHGDIFDFMGLSRTPYNKLNIHCNGVYGDKESALDRFCKNFERLPESVQSRLTVENDDKASMYSVKELYDGIYKRIGIPIVFDYHHHRFCDGGLSEQEALELATSTWGDIKPVVHYSESRSKEKLDESIKPQAHSDLIKQLPNTYGNDVDIMVEAKHKELAIKKFTKGVINELNRN